MKEIVNFAPIIIPTLNRLTHLKRCIESLSRNTYADKTSLIISVDYPPSLKYSEGYQEVCDYLSKGISGFKSVDIIYQKENIGSLGNYVFLRKYVADKGYDRYIYLEDDIEVASCFVEFIDTCLQEFENDMRIHAVCAAGGGYAGDYARNVALSRNFSAAGYGAWINKSFFETMTIDREYFVKVAKNKGKMKRLLTKGGALLFTLQHIIMNNDKLFKESVWYDETIKIYMLMEDKFAISGKTMIKNWGYDGTGDHCGVNESYIKYDMPNDEVFELKYTNDFDVIELPQIDTVSAKLKAFCGYLLIKIRNLF